MTSARLYILGSGRLRRKVIDHEKFGVEFAGEVSHDEVPNWLCNASLFLFPSVLETGMPMAVLEAMTLKVPVVATMCGGIPDGVTDGKTGIRTEPNSIDALAETIVRALTSNLNQNLVNAYKYVRKNYDMDECVNAYIKVYEWILQSKLSRLPRTLLGTNPK